VALLRLSATGDADSDTTGLLHHQDLGDHDVKTIESPKFIDNGTAYALHFTAVQCCL
jgi:hypothetical protein